MGNNACGCGSNNERQKPILYEVPNESWAEAVSSLNLAAVKGLHQEEPDLINECVSSQGYIAIQVAVKKQNFELFEYLLKYGGNINAPTGDDGNSCLHLAVINKDIKIIKHLFAYDVDDTLYNNIGKTASDLITDNNFRRNYIKIKNATKHQMRKNQNYTNLIKSKSHLETTIGGVIVNEASTTQLKQIMTGSGDDILNLNGVKGHHDIQQTKKRNEEMFRQKYVEISSRNSQIHLTEFGQDIGCEIDEIAYCVQHLNINDKLSKLWDKWVKKSKITKTHDLLKIIYGITVLTLRNRQKQNKYSGRSSTTSHDGDDDTNSIKPPSEPIKRLTSKVYKMLPRYKVESMDGDNNRQEKPRKKKHVLTRNDFINNFHTYLYHAHEQFLDEQHQIHKKVN